MSESQESANNGQKSPMWGSPITSLSSSLAAVAAVYREELEAATSAAVATTSASPPSPAAAAMAGATGTGKRAVTSAKDKEGPSLPKKAKAKAGVHKFVVSLDEFDELSSDFDSFSMAPYPMELVPGTYYASSHYYSPSILPGDHVRRVNRGKLNFHPKEDEGGYCTKSETFLTVRIRGTEKIIENVPSRDLLPLSSLNAGVCLYKNWIGYIKDVKRNVIIQCKDGSKMSCKAESLAAFKDVWDDGRYRRCPLLHHNGQKLSGPRSALKDATLLTLGSSILETSTDSEDDKVVITVVDSSVASVTIKWFRHLTQLFQSYQDGVHSFDSEESSRPLSYKNSRRDLKDFKEKMPDGTLSGSDILLIKPLKLVKSFPAGPSERGYYVIKESDELKDYNEWHVANGEADRGRFAYEFCRFQDIKDKIKASTAKLPISKASSKPLGFRVSMVGLKNGSDSAGSAKTETKQSGAPPAPNDGGSGSKPKTLRALTKVLAEVAVPSTSSGSSGIGPSLFFPPVLETDAWDVWPSTSSSSKRSVVVKNMKEKRHKPDKETYLVDSLLMPGAQVAVEVLTKKSFVSVAWQNGVNEDNIPSSQLFPIHHFDIHNFFPGDYVVENKDYSDRNEYGVVQRTNLSARTATVRWFTKPSRESLPQFVKVEDVSVYDIKRRVDISFRLGDCVIRFPIQVKEDLSDPASRAGQVIDFHSENGQLLCIWANGTKSLVYPQELFKINEHYELWSESKAFKKASESPFATATDTLLSSSLNEMVASAEIGMEDDWYTDDSSFDYADDGPDVEVVEEFKKNVNKLESWIKQNDSITYPSALSAINLTYRLNSGLKNVEELLGTNLEKAKDLQTLISKTKSEGGSHGTIQAISTNLTRALARMKNKRANASASESSSSTSTLPSSSSAETQESGNRLQPVAGSSKESSDQPQHLEGYLSRCFGLMKKLSGDLLEISSKLDKEPIKDLLESIKNRENGLNEIEEEETPPAEDNGPVEANATHNHAGCHTFQLLESVPDSHHYKRKVFQPQDPTGFPKRVAKEISLLKNSLPPSILVKGYEDRIDLYSALIKGPASTPYEDCIFLFDILLPHTYPNAPPSVHYFSFCTERINPNLYENGKVCVSLLGTWSGSGIEKWCPKQSNLLQLLVSIQGLILVAEPYYNEPGYVKQKGCAVGAENSRLYNEMVVVKLVQSMTKLVKDPPEVFAEEIREHFRQNGQSLLARLQKWIKMSKCSEKTDQLLDFPLLPGSQGFVLSLEKSTTYFQQALESVGLSPVTA